MLFTKPQQVFRRKSSTPHYQTFPTAPPKSKGRPPSSSPPPSHSRGPSTSSSHHHHRDTPLPLRQLLVLAVISLSEQTALNSIGPYLPQMAGTFPEVDDAKVAIYVGSIASAFALAQFATNFFWGWLSDRVGRKPVIMAGTALTAVCFVAFGFCRTLWQAILVQAVMGAVNGNQGIVSTCLGEITDRSNQSKAFTYLPVIYGLGAITGPAVGGLLIGVGSTRLPYLAPNLFSAALLSLDLIVTAAFLEESLEEARKLPPLGKRIGELFSWAWQFAASSTRPSYVQNMKRRQSYRYGDENGNGNGDARSFQNVEASLDDDTSSGDEEEEEEEEEEDRSQIPALLAGNGHPFATKEILNRDTILLLSTYLVFQLSNVAFNSLYPIFAEGREPTGRELSAKGVGLSLSFAGAVTILFQIGLFGKLRQKLGNKVTYRTGLGGFVLVFLLMPWIGYKSDPRGGDGGVMSSGLAWLWFEIGVVLFLKTICTVSGLTSALLLITNSAPDHAVLGALNGLAQTLSAGGRAVGPFVSGSLYFLAVKIAPKGEALPFGVFGGIAFLGFLGTWGIRGGHLEADSSSGDEESSDAGSDAASGNESESLLRR